jgi:steroid 5-alpha reductase family enzyme
LSFFLLIEAIAFLVMWIFGDETVNDFAGGSNFLILALVTLNLGGTYYARNIVVSVLVMVRQIDLTLIDEINII